MAKIIDPKNFPGLSSQNIRSVDFIYSFQSLFIFFQPFYFHTIDSVDTVLKKKRKKKKETFHPEQAKYFFPTVQGQIENSDRKFGTKKFLILIILGKFWTCSRAESYLFCTLYIVTTRSRD